jgi:DNA-binding beta-propeller fold protein YncE
MVYNESLAKLYISCNDDPVYRIVVLDATADTILRYISARGVGRLLWHPVTNRVFSCGADTIRVIDCLTDEIAVRTRGGGEVWCYNPVNNLVYLAARYQVYVLSPTGDSVVGSVPGWAYDVAAMPFPNKVYASGSAAGIQVIDGASNSVIDTIPVIAGRMVCDATRARAYAVGAGAYIIDARADTLIKTIPMGQALCRMCHNSVNSRVYVTDETGNVVYVIRDTSTGISEAVPAALAWTRRSAVTVVRRAMSWSGQTPAALVDLAGRRVLALNPGRNDLTRLAPGVYVAIASGTGEVRRVVKVE